MPSLNTVVMVPKGAEFNAVKKGLRSVPLKYQEDSSLKLVSLPVGPEPVKAFLREWCDEFRPMTANVNVVLMGLCGSLTPRLGINDSVLYERCIDGVSSPDRRTLACRNAFLESPEIFTCAVTPVTGVMCDRVISKAAEKAQIGAQFQADVVDMEGFAALEILINQVKSVAMLRVVSDDAEFDLPDLTDAFDPQGNIKPWVLARQFLGQPLGALRLIRGSLSGLKQLENLASDLMQQETRKNDGIL